ncbi:MAG: 30S ribosomal protein S3 [Kiritimatiellae bacterium]|nr:30S ribosomal protein S3 [Kiritimatiellia bacterium]
MGQKVNPIALRVTVDKDWRSRWFGRKQDFGEYVIEDHKIRTLVKKRFESAGVAEVRIERYANRVRVNIHTAKPAMVVGRRGQDIERLRSELEGLTGGKEIYIEIHEVRDPDTNAQLVAEAVAAQLLRRVSFRRAMKHAIRLAMDKKVEGIKIRLSGRLAGAELARSEWYKEGKIPLHTLSAHVEYGFAEARTTAGLIGVKVWICKKVQEPTEVLAERKAHAVNA